ncbi:MAG: cysteine desulfurase NifS [Chitinispirillaceae bacterium]|jgi:cysteine desulfurase
MRKNRTEIYLDNNATSAVAPEVLEAMLPFFKDSYGNPSSIHRFGGMLKKHIEYARGQVSDLLNASPEEIVFTSCGSESDNMALKGFCAVHGSRSRIVTSTVEHPAVRTTSRHLREKGLAALLEIKVNGDGTLSMDEFNHAPMDADTLVSLMWANNETGVIFPVKELAEAAKERGAAFHTDAVQAVGKIPIDLKKTPVDFLALSGHKLHAPKGVGVLYIRNGTAIEPLIHGGHQERMLRAGTENIAFIVGLGRAAELAKKSMNEENERIRRLRDRLEEALLRQCPAAKLNGHKQMRLPTTTNVSFESIEGEAILLHLDELGIAASSGSACTTGSLEPSHVMLAMGIPYTFAHSSIRFSLSRYTTEAEIDAVIAAMPPIVKKLRSLSPFVESTKNGKDKKTYTLATAIARLKHKKNTVILAHNYQPGEVQDAADFVGDSYGLSVEATKVKADTIIFCGVRFMAETAAILNPAKTVVLAEPDAGCPMADMIKASDLFALKRMHPLHLVMCYVNSTAEVKALSDICCTSSNALEIARKLPDDQEIIFVPDKYLGDYVAENLGRPLVLWNGFCPTHARITPEMVEQARHEHPGALVMIHPEAPRESRHRADQVLSTGGMCAFVKNSEHTEFIAATEIGILHTLRKQNPGKKFYPVSTLITCPNMRKTSLASIMNALEGKGGEIIKVPPEIAAPAERALRKMLEMSGKK